MTGTRRFFLLLASVLPLLPAATAFAQDGSAPTAVADGPGTVSYGSLVYLSGARSTDVGGAIAQYEWMRLSGEGGEMPLNQVRASNLPGIELAQYLGNPLRPGRHRFALVVTDSAGNRSQPVEVAVVVTDNIPPVAILGAHTSLRYGSPIVLHGEHSADIPGRVMQLNYSRVQGPESPAMPLGQVFARGLEPFTVPQSPNLAPGTHVFRLVVVDDGGNQSAPRDLSVTIQSTADNAAPVAVLDAPASIGIGSSLTLSATRSTDAGGQIRRYEWMRLSGEGGAGMPINQSFITDQSSFVVPQAAGALLGIGRQRFRLAVQDDAGNASQPVEREVLVVDNLPPTPVLDAPANVLPGEAFALSAQRSTDRGGRVVQYSFTRVSGSRTGPMQLGVPVVSSDPVLNLPESRANPFTPGRQVFRLVVTDDSGNQSRPLDVAVEVVAKR